jgi:hypothetical protein
MGDVGNGAMAIGNFRRPSPKLWQLENHEHALQSNAQNIEPYIGTETFARIRAILNDEICAGVFTFDLNRVFRVYVRVCNGAIHFAGKYHGTIHFTGKRVKGQKADHNGCQRELTQLFHWFSPRKM